MTYGILLSFFFYAGIVGPAAAQSVPVLSITFEGNQGLDATRLKSQLRLSRDGGWYHPETLKLELSNLERFYQDEGFLRARMGPPMVEMQAVPGRGQAAVIRVPVQEGPLYRLGELSINGAEVFKANTLLHMTPIRSGQPYSRRKIAEWQKVIEDGYHTMGYIRFESKVIENIRESEKVVDSIVELAEGQAYRVGKITIEGDDSVNPLEIKKLLLLGEGSLYNPQNLSLSLYFLNGTRKYRPIRENDVQVDIEDATLMVHFTFRLVPLQKSSSSIDD